jgi:hypothetical protein
MYSYILIFKFFFYF